MFTGIVQELGRVTSLDPHQTGARIAIECAAVLADVQIGASIAVNGACITAVQLSENSFSADLSPETLKRTNLGELRPSSPVNLERPLGVGARLDGHFVLGHVDSTVELVTLSSLGENNWWLTIRLPHEFARYVVSKGSLALDGVSLTVAEIDGDLASFTILPHTYTHTTLHAYKPGARLNLEVDILAKHVEKLIASSQIRPAEPALPG
jgi:riboflavin synthase